MPSLPTGTVTFLFTDIEGSTELLQRLGDRRYADVLAGYRRLVRAAIQEKGGQEMGAQGDALFFTFQSARDGLAAAVAAQSALAEHPWPENVSVRVRMGLHTGETLPTETEYVGVDIHRVARICAAGHGGQILLSQSVHDLVADEPRGAVSFRDLGEHRFKDLTKPQHVFQAVAPGLPADFPPLKSLDVRPNNLPIQLTSFIGREREIAEIKRLLGRTRLLTLTGSGGCGKTRLALQVAADLLEQYPDGVWLVELSSLADPALVANSVAAALDVPERPNRPLTEILANYLRNRNMLLLLDNCEHLNVACQRLTEHLLLASATLRILTTSREALGVAGELTYRVPPLRLPDARLPPPVARLAECDAIRLFTERAALNQPEFTLTERNAPAIVQICQRLDGMPLAIEFAAARVLVLSVDQISERLNDRFRLLTAGTRKTLPRHQTLRATLDWSYDLLSENERALLRRLSVFAGGWTLEAAEAVCGRDGLEGSDILNLLSRLVEKSLVLAETRNGAARYYMLETVRQYAQDKLIEEDAADQMRRAHRDWYLALAEQAAPELRGPRAELWLERLETEHDNLRAALEWSKEEKDGTEAGLRLVGALHWFWFRHDYWSEGMTWTEGALVRSSEAPPSALPGALVAATDFAWRRGEDRLATTFGEKGLALCRELEDKENGGFLLSYLGIVAMLQADYQQATALFDECVHVSRELGHRWLYGWTLAQLGIMAWFQGDDERATAFHTQSLAVLREVGDKWSIAYALQRFGRDVALQQRHYDQATASFRDSLILCSEAGNRWISEECLEGLARVASARGHYERAARLFGAAEAQREIVGYRFALPDQAHHHRSVASARAGLGDASFTAAWAEGRAMTLEQAIEYALRVEH